MNTDNVIAICMALCFIVLVGGCTTNIVNLNNNLYKIEMEKLKHLELKQD